MRTFWTYPFNSAIQRKLAVIAGCCSLFLPHRHCQYVKDSAAYTGSWLFFCCIYQRYQHPCPLPVRTAVRGKSCGRIRRKPAPGFVLAGLVPWAFSPRTGSVGIHAFERPEERRGYADQVRARRPWVGSSESPTGYPSARRNAPAARLDLASTPAEPPRVGLRRLIRLALTPKAA
jgi:hypothetical protein